MESDKLILKWKKEFPWFSYSGEKGYCEYWKLTNLLSAYSAGVAGLKKSNLQDHEESVDHKNAEKATHAKNIQARIKFLATVPKLPSLTSEKSEVPSNFSNLRKAISFLAKENIPLIKSPSLLSMIEKCGVALSQSYRDRHAAHYLVERLSSMLEDTLIEKLKKKSFLGIQIDESTDISKESVLIAYVSFFSEGKTSENIYKILSHYLKEKGIFEKIVSLCTDGAKVMSSNKNGVAGLFQKELKRVIFFHCLAHKINLVTTDILDRFPCVKNLQSFKYELVKFFLNSPKRINLLDEIQDDILGEVLSLIRPIIIRWVSMYGAIKRIIELWNPIYKLKIQDIFYKLK